MSILADSISPLGVRLTTFEVTFPRFILAEVNTHRMLSRNSASSRAIPTEKLIEQVRKNPFLPETFNKRVKGMGVGEAFSEQEREEAEVIWRHAALEAVKHAQFLNDLELDKSRVNRLLEPFMWHTAIISGTEWSNFFALRTDKGAQPEFRIIAEMMEEAYDFNHRLKKTKYFDYGEWHRPLVFEEDEKALIGDDKALNLLSAGRCARVSYDRQHDTEAIEKSIDRAEKLKSSGHWSPLEHIATPAKDDNSFSGNLRGWTQYRKLFNYEHDFAQLKRYGLAND